MKDPQVEKELIELERTFWRAMKERDVETAMGLTDFPCIVAGSQGVMSVDAAAFEKMMRGATYRIRSAELDGACVRQLSDDVAVVAYKVHEELDVDGEPLSLDAHDSSTWVRRDGRWRCAQHSESLKGDPFGRDRALPPAVGL